RLLAPRLGAPVVFGLTGDGPPPAGEFNVAQLVSDYGLPALGPVEELYGIVADAARSSLSPRLHNAAYRALGRPALYVPFGGPSLQVLGLDIVRDDALGGVGMSLRGLTVGAPHKEAVLALAGSVSPMARRAAAANVACRTPRGWVARTTDPAGVLLPLRARGV